MNAPCWVLELAERFWTLAGDNEPPPRSLRRALTRAFPLAVVALAGLTLAGMQEWLRQRRLPCPGLGADRPLCGCLWAWRNGGYIFIDSTDSEAEQRFTLAHELAHYLRDYWQPRRGAVQLCGPAILEVCDGLRSARPAECLRGLLGERSVTGHAHLLFRDGGSLLPEIARSEESADRLAFELLAPVTALTAIDRTALRQELEVTFGLPAHAAARYAQLLTPEAPETDPLLLRVENALWLSNFSLNGGMEEGGSDG